jgi:uncharacterized membrane protein YphA (DoxX/SURF4 family)
MNKHALVYSFGAILLGAVGIAFHDFILQWEPVPAGVPFRTPLAILSALLLITGGLAVLTGKYQRQGALLLTLFFGFWAAVLHGVDVVRNPDVLILWNGIAEIGFITCGGVALYASTAPRGRDTMLKWSRLAAGAFALMFGSVHIHYIDGTASFVPAWIPPNQHFWAWATGIGYIAAGLALLSGVQARLAASLTTFMMASFVVLLHIPRVIASPHLQVEWCMVGVATTLTGAAWLLRKYAT